MLLNKVKVKDIVWLVVVMVSEVLLGRAYRITQNKLYPVLAFLIVIANIIYVIVWFIRTNNNKRAETLFVIYKKIFQNNKEEEFKQVLKENDFEALTSWAFLNKKDLEILQKDRTKVTTDFEFFMRGLEEVVKENPDITMDFLRKNG